MENPEQLGIKELVSSATSYFKGSSTERMQNIQVSASKFHGLVIPPGEVFSFNQHLGDVTAENGFVESLIIQGDRTAVGVGGGVCQVSTTAFRSAFFGGFEIVERWAHGYRVGWYETGSSPGLDATIYSPNVDFKFRNDTNSYILIQTDTDLTAGTITFNFYGASPNRTVTISEPLESNKVPHGPDIYQEDASLEPDEVKQVDWAQDGVDITIYRTVLEGDKVIHKDTLFSRYRPWQNIYKVGPTSKEDKE
jgi:vancomycin resistance protein YoaR